MTGNFTFTHKEDADRFQRNNGGTVHNNQHSALPWNGNQFTVHIPEAKQAPKGVDCEGEEVYFTKEEWNDYMELRGWREEVKEMHRKKFTGTVYFDEYGYFDHV